MAWLTTVFDRQTLYEEVWTEPVVSVASRYRISGVGLKKICVKLDIPVPARGYWAKLAAGQKVKKEPLRVSNVHPTFTRSVRIEEVDDILERRVIDARASCPAGPVQDYEYTIPVDASLRTKEAKQIEIATKKIREIDGTISMSGWAWADISVSHGARQRALFLLDRFASAILAINGHFAIERPQPPTHAYAQRRSHDTDRGHFRVHGEDYFVRVKERIAQEEVVNPIRNPLLRAGGSQRTSDPSAFVLTARKFEFIPTGQLVFSVFRVGSNYEVKKTEDTSSSQVEDKLSSLIVRLEELSLRRKVQLEIRHERELERQRQTKIWEAKKAHRAALLLQLTTFEAMAKNLDRADSLRRLAKRAGELEEVPAALSGALELLALMADWLDPLVKQRWPDVDDVPEINPCRVCY
jgi:hypothetical protein